MVDRETLRNAAACSGPTGFSAGASEPFATRSCAGVVDSSSHLPDVAGIPPWLADDLFISVPSAPLDVYEALEPTSSSAGMVPQSWKHYLGQERIFLCDFPSGRSRTRTVRG